MDKTDWYFASRFIIMFCVGWIIGIDQLAKLLGVAVCILSWQWITILEARDTRAKALEELREQLVKEQYGRPLR
jgi:hypothetical protein